MHQEKKMLAHISEDGTRVQTVADHLQGTAVLCGQFAAAFDAQQQGTWLGLLHDIGKYSTKFQKRLQGGEKVDHSTAGAQVAARYGQIPLVLLLRDTIAACRMEEAEAIPRRMRQCLGD